MAPATEAELLSRARSLAGRTLDEVRVANGAAVPSTGHKGWVGSLVERALGLSARGAGPDAPELGIELKTMPIDARGIPRESTFVCMVPREGLDRSWRASAPYAKLARVLFVPVESLGAMASRRVGSAFLWSPDADEEAALENDWTELAGQLRTSGHEHVSARLGRHMQIRPKAASARSRWRATGDDDAPMLALPRAFYLRRAFVASILSRSGLASPRVRT
jgi:DNA mismatch repair protein MutH